jgi:hypothetical protein
MFCNWCSWQEVVRWIKNRIREWNKKFVWARTAKVYFALFEFWLDEVKAFIVAQLVKKFPASYSTGIVFRIQSHTNSIHNLTSQFFTIHYITLPPMLRAHKWFLPFMFPDRNSVYIPYRYHALLHVVQTGSGAHPATYPMATGVKAAGEWSWSLTSN